MVVVGFAAVFVLQEAVAQDAQLAVPPAWARVPVQERDVPQAAQPAAQDALPAPVAAQVAHSVALRADLQGGPQDDCLAAHC